MRTLFRQSAFFAVLLTATSSFAQAAVGNEESSLQAELPSRRSRPTSTWDTPTAPSWAAQSRSVANCPCPIQRPRARSARSALSHPTGNTPSVVSADGKKQPTCEEVPATPGKYTIFFDKQEHHRT